MKIDQIATIICDYYKVDKQKLFKKGKAGNLVKAKQLTSYFAKKMLGMSFMQIATYFNLKEHTTVLARVRTIEDCISCRDYVYDDYVNVYKDVHNAAIGTKTLVMLNVDGSEDLHRLLREVSQFKVEIEVVHKPPVKEEPEVKVIEIKSREVILSPADEVRRKYL